ncbi:MAG: hypothetical protein ABL994_19650 [Verrucomicrobiales bacterium]
MKSFSELPNHRELRRLWKQEPLDRPTANLELTPDSWVERGAEVLGWSLARFEYWLSASGWLRAWLRLNLFLSVLLMIAGVLLLPPAERVLRQLAQSSRWVTAVVHDLFGILTSLPPVVISLGILYLTFLMTRWVIRRRSGRRGEGYYS